MADLALRPVSASFCRRGLPTARELAVPALAAAIAAAAGLLGWRGTDLPAQLYRIGLFQRQGLTLWDSQWYSGHWTLNYSVLFPPVAGTLGVQGTEMLSVALAAWSFDRLVRRYFGPSARLGSVAFAVGTLVQIGIGQLPFLLGEALALAAYWAASRRRWWLATVLALLATLASPEAGAFLALGVTAWLVATSRNRSDLRPPRLALVAIAVAAVAPVLVTAALFPGQGNMPFPVGDFAAEGAVFLVATLVIPRTAPAFRLAAGLYLLVFAASFVLPSPLGSNIERLGETLGVPLAICLLWPLRRLALAVVAIPITLMQWVPAVTTVTANRSNPAAHSSYFAPLIDYIQAHDSPPGRVEIVPTALHWEAAYAAPVLPLARGWERQLDTADNPIFYTSGALTAASYRAWLIDNGVRYVALPDVNLDYAAVAEGKLMSAGIPGLRLAWHNAHWRLYLVVGSPGLISGPARLVQLTGGVIDLEVTAPGTIHVKERYSPDWEMTAGSGCIGKDAGGWLAVQARVKGPVRADVRLFAPPHQPC